MRSYVDGAEIVSVWLVVVVTSTVVMVSQVREAIVMNQADSSTTVRVRDSTASEWRELMTFPYGEQCNIAPNPCAVALAPVPWPDP